MSDKLEKRQLTVGVGAVISRGKLLFVKRHAPDIPEYDRKWELPGGKIEIGEAPEAAIEREILEEAGVPVSCTEILPFTFSRKLQERDNQVLIHVIVLCAECIHTPDQDLDSQVLPDHEFTWFDIDSIPFDKIIPGSREFVLWILKNRFDADISDEAKIYEIELEAIDNSENKMRGYRVVLYFKPDSSERFEVERQYGRIGQPYRSRRKSFSRMDQAIDYAQKIVSKRERHGYQLTSVDENHPLRSWIKLNEIPTSRSLQPTLFDKEARNG